MIGVELASTFLKAGRLAIFYPATLMTIWQARKVKLLYGVLKMQITSGIVISKLATTIINNLQEGGKGTVLLELVNNENNSDADSFTLMVTVGSDMQNGSAIIGTNTLTIEIDIPPTE